MQPPHQPPPGHQQFAPPPPPPGLVPPLGPPPRVQPALRTTALVALGVALLGLSVFGGYEVARTDASKLEAVLWFLPAIAAFLAMTLVWQDTVFSLRCDGRVLEGTGLLGRQGVDLARLTSVTSAVSARTVDLQLRDELGGLSVRASRLAAVGQPVLDVVGRAVWEGQQQRRYVVPVGAAGVWGMPPLPGAPANGSNGVTPRALVSVLLLVTGLVVGMVLGF